MRGPTDQEVMRELARIKTRVQLGIPGAHVDIVGVANTQNHLSAWLIKVRKRGRVAEHVMNPDQTADSAVEALKAGLEQAKKGKAS